MVVASHPFSLLTSLGAFVPGMGMMLDLKIETFMLWK